MFVITLSELPSTSSCDYDLLLNQVLEILDARSHIDSTGHYELLVLCAGGKYRPSWPWLVQAFSKLDRTYRKDMQRLILVHGERHLSIYANH